MPKLVALWTEASDVEAFTSDYKATHEVLCKALPGIAAVRTGTTMPGGPYQRVTELEFATADEMMAALGSPDGVKVLEDAGRLMEAFGNKVETVIVTED